MIITFSFPFLDNTSKLLIEHESLVGVSALCLSFLFFAPWAPFQNFWPDTFKIVSQTCSLSPKVMAIPQIPILQIAAESRLQVLLTCLRFGPIFLCVKMSCTEAVRCWSKYNWCTLGSHKAKTVSVLHKKYVSFEENQKGSTWIGL